MSPLTERQIGQWARLVEKANRIRKNLDAKPKEIRLGTSLSPGSILNAYREGDMSFDEAVTAINRYSDYRTRTRTA